MLEYPEFDENGLQVLCEMNGRHSDMNMNIYVRKMKPDEQLTIEEKENETAVLLLSGKVRLKVNGTVMECERENPFELKPYTVHISKNTKLTVSAVENSEIIIQQTNNEKEFEPHFYGPENTLYQEFGKGQWGGAGHRVVSTMFDYDNAPYSNLVMGEVFTKAGKWSSYPPHHHPQPEVYYYKFDKPQGFGACFCSDDVYKSKDGSVYYIEPGKDHEQAAAPGYEMYYVWLIRHIDGDPWYKTTRFVSPEHEWLTKA